MATPLSDKSEDTESVSLSFFPTKFTEWGFSSLESHFLPYVPWKHLPKILALYTIDKKFTLLLSSLLHFLCPGKRPKPFTHHTAKPLRWLNKTSIWNLKVYYCKHMFFHESLQELGSQNASFSSRDGFWVLLLCRENRTLKPDNQEMPKFSCF